MGRLRGGLSEKGRLAFQADGRRVNAPSKVNRQKITTEVVPRSILKGQNGYHGHQCFSCTEWCPCGPAESEAPTRAREHFLEFGRRRLQLLHRCRLGGTDLG